MASSTSSLSLKDLPARALARLKRTSTASLIFYVLSILLLLLPQVLPNAGDSEFLRLPRIWSGDEPAYLVQITSAARDFDADLSNNYDSALAGGDDAGERRRGALLDRHLAAGFHGHTAIWHEFYDSDAWKHAEHHVWPPPRIPNTPEPPDFRYSSHPDGLIVLLTPVWLVFGHTSLLEPAVVFCSGLTAIALLFLLRAWMRTLTDDKLSIYVALAATMFGTPLWHYGRSIFNEIYLATFAAAIYFIAFHSKRRWLFGVPIALGLLMKPFFLLLGLPAFFVLRRSFKELFLACVPIGMAGVYVLVTNWLHFGSPLLFPQPSQYFAWSPTAATGLLFDAKHGLLPYAPVLLVALLGWPALLRARPLEATLVAAGAASYSAIFLFVGFWDGGFCFGPRYLLPTIPLWMLGMTQLRSTFVGRKPWAVALAALIGLTSVTINALGALPYSRSWNKHPLSPYLEDTPALFPHDKPKHKHHRKR
ncbi:MAG TPA: hypothetical protein VLJ38_15100 [Polyangiaceae bacterium]|nr:hypothetical protein [Polyangiaceae bacterium]